APQVVGETGDERRLRPDDDEVCVEGARQLHDALRVLRTHGMAGSERGDPGVAGGRMQLAQARARAELPGERVLASAGTHEQHLHVRQCLRPVRAAQLPRRLQRMAEPPPYAAKSVDVLRLPEGRSEPDAVAVEEPLEIRIGGQALAVTMRTPGHDEELALGFCLSEGVAATAAALPADLAANTVDVEAPEFDRSRVQRSFYTSSSCGVCGKGALEAVAVEAERVASRLTVPATLVAELPGRLRQPAFDATGGLHATGLFDERGRLVCLREDVGRHNAMDKVIGWAFLQGRLPLADSILCLSGRLS